jgi:hypothetical protein
MFCNLPIYSTLPPDNHFSQVRTQNFSFGEGGGKADPEATYNLCLILEIML